MDFLDPDNIFFTVFDYDMSYVEFFGTALNLASVWLIVRRNVFTWPVGIAGVVLFAALFYQIELYSDFLEQLYFLVTGFYGWWLWTRRGQLGASVPNQVTLLGKKGRTIAAAAVGMGTASLGVFMANVHEILPQLFPEPAALPYLDAFTTVMSFAAQILMAHRKLESWLLWILVDVIGIWLYYDRGVVFISMLYGVFLVMAVRGLLEWARDAQAPSESGARTIALPATAR
jgi:nicotinamide mononucleotide transporter